MPRARATPPRPPSRSRVDSSTTPIPSSAILPLAKGAGLPGLGGAKVEVVFADNQGTPAAGQNQALRLITEEKVVALIGAYQSGITLTASAIAERYGIPFLNGESVAANLTERGFKWFFRTTPVAADFAKTYMDFLKEQKAARHQGRQASRSSTRTPSTAPRSPRCCAEAAKDGLNITQKIPYSANTTDVQSAGAAAQGEEARRRDLRLLHVRRHPLHEDDEGAELEAADPDRRQLPASTTPPSSRASAHRPGRRSTAPPSTPASPAA